MSISDATLNNRTILVCDCEGTMPLDGAALARGLDIPAPAIHRYLCRDQMGIAQAAAAAAPGGHLCIACTQEAPFFLDALAPDEEGDLAGPALSFFNIREKAGWSEQAAQAAPKVAALMAEAALDLTPAPSVTMESQGRLLILGRDEAALEAAARLADRLVVTVVLTGDAPVIPPRLVSVPLFHGTVQEAHGHLGAFQVTIAAMAPARPSSRGRLQWAEARRTETLETDLILDLRAGLPPFTGADKRDGYRNPDPGNPALVEAALLDLTDMVGTFEKPRYVDFTARLCAHERARITGCTRCLDACPAGAITSATDAVLIDPHLCGGCGHCASVCPTGAASYAQPTAADLFKRLRTLLGTYRRAAQNDGGTAPVVLVHDTDSGEAMIDALARHGRGLPARVIPLAVNQVTQLGLDALLAAVAYGAEAVVLLVPASRTVEAAPLAGEAALANAVLSGLSLGGERIVLFDGADPDALGTLLYDLPPSALPGAPATFAAPGGKRDRLNQALAHLHGISPAPVEAVALPAGAPLGAVRVRVEGCTLCLSCVGACPTGALKDNPDKPQLRFLESACVQCGLCVATCPEKVMALDPRVAFTDAARRPAVVKEEEPFECERCGKPFASKSAIERMTEKLSAHPMFSGDKLAMLRMCEDCRVVAMMEDPNHPFAMGAPRTPKTTDDYLREREELRRQAAADQARRDGGDDAK
ncbi:MAG: 4Fe-4S dicluster domain-containing protein [Rhodobacterales bacterium]|nr:4Fe-4S dicluster domain-containing protein [Rhodobacterales bacterium]